MEDPRSDHELIEASLQDKEQYRHIINRYRPKLLRYINHIGIHDRPQQEDILQDVFIKVYRHLYAYNSDFLFSSWIYRITHNQTMDYFRKNRLQPLSLDRLLETNPLFPLEDFPSNPHQTEKIIPIESITVILNQLDQKYKDVIVLKYFEDKSYDEIADILQKPPGTIATLINRAKQKIKILLTQEIV